jgi:fused signal recognition particle receptor
MVYDWFNRSAEGAASDAQEPQPAATPAAPATSESEQDTDQASSQDDALAWAREAYARLKAQQEAARTPAPAEAPQDLQEPAPAEPIAPAESAAPPEPEQVKEPAPAPSLLELAAAQRAERLEALTAADSPSLSPAPAVPAAAEPQLGDFDDTFTWSAEVLAAQGKRVDQISLEEIDWLTRLRQGLEKTRQGFVTQLLENLGDDPLTPAVLDDLETTLLRADVGVQATDQVLEALRRRLNTEVVDPAEGIRFLKEQLRDLLETPIRRCDHPLLAPQRGRLNVWLLVGVNGVGKTTTLGKLANLAVRSGYSALIAAADTFRAAAVQQVQVWGERSGVPVIANPSANADPAAVVYDAIGAAQAKGTELVLVDTAGRLQTKNNLMEELAKVRRIVDKLAPDAAVESLLVLDASQGQNGLRQAMAFASAAGLTGVVLTKLDGSARGGVALAVASEAGLPIRFIGAGEGIRDLRPFNSFEFVEALLAG